jgi:hypothetical protein
MGELTVHHLPGKLNVAADHLSRPDKDGPVQGLDGIQVRVMNEAWMLDSRLPPGLGCIRNFGESPRASCRFSTACEDPAALKKTASGRLSWGRKKGNPGCF